MNLNTTVVISPSVIGEDIDGKTVLLHLDSEQYFSLDEVGARIWQLLKTEQKLGAIADVLCQEYEATIDQLQSDVLALVADLEAAQLISVNH